MVGKLEVAPTGSRFHVEDLLGIWMPLASLAPSQPLDRHCVAKSCQRWMFIMSSEKFLWIFLIAIGTKIPSYWKLPLIICKNWESGCSSLRPGWERYHAAPGYPISAQVSVPSGPGVFLGWDAESMARQQELQLELPTMYVYIYICVIWGLFFRPK